MNKNARKKRNRTKIKARSNRPRLSVFRSHRYLWVQIIDDQKGKTLAAASDKELKTAQKKLTKTEKARLVGEIIAQKALKLKIKEVVFDRGAYQYHGRLKSLAEGARKGGLKF